MEAPVTICNSRGSGTLFWPLPATGIYGHGDQNIHAHKIDKAKIDLKKKSTEVISK